MREIKFRAWDGIKMIMPRDKQYYQYYLSFCGSIIQSSWEGMSDFGDQWNVIRNLKMMQYTGLKDKNGTDIYEGDLLMVKDVRLSEVVFHEYAGCWDLILRNALSSDSIGGVSAASYQYHTVVIGNIYESPELMS